MAQNFRSRRFTCPFFLREMGAVLSCEGCTVRAPERKSMVDFEDRYCASDAVSWKRCPIARMLLEFYDRED